ncbi:Hypothetical protein A7982_10012 [Minicystis rosea]|nr:Hypothetical protein A7982_10012 [Minicystis rosea]
MSCADVDTRSSTFEHIEDGETRTRSGARAGDSCVSRSLFGE